MGRRLPRRVWHTVAALVPLPLIGLGYVAAVPGNPVAFQVELFLSGNGSTYALKRTADMSHGRPLPRRGVLSVPGRPQRPTCRPGSRRQHRHLSRQAAHCREPWRRSDHDRLARHARRGQPRAQGRPPSRPSPTSLCGARSGATMASSMLMNASYGSPFSQNFDVDGFKPSAGELAYHPTAEGLPSRARARARPNSRSASAAASPPPSISRRAASRYAARSQSPR